MRALIVLLLLTTTLSASPFPKVARYDLDISISPNSGTMTGNVGVYFDKKKDVDTRVTFFLHGELRVDSILQAGHAIAFDESQVFYSYDYSLIADKIEVQIDSLSPRDSLRIFYGGYFSPSKARSPSDYMRIESAGVLLRAYGYSPWFPIFLESGAPSYQTTFRPVTLRIPSSFQIVFCGKYLIDTVEAGIRVSPWSAENIDLFAAQCSAQKWKILRKGGLYAFHYPDDASTKQAYKVLAFADKLLGSYRANYSDRAVTGEQFILELPQFGDISSGNVTGLAVDTWKAFDEETSAKIALAHEMAYPFVNANVPKSDSIYALAIEGFPSYFHLPALGAIWGRDWYDNFMEWTEQQYLDKKRTGTDSRGRLLPSEKPLLSITADVVGAYKDVFVLNDRALLFLNYLRVRMGDKSFRYFCKQLFSGSATTAESFERLCWRYLPFQREEIRQWLHTSDFPDRFRINGSKGK